MYVQCLVMEDTDKYWYKILIYRHDNNNNNILIYYTPHAHVIGNSKTQ